MKVYWDFDMPKDTTSFQAPREDDTLDLPALEEVLANDNYASTSMDRPKRVTQILTRYGV